MIRFHSLDTPELERFLERHKASFTLRTEIDLDVVLRQILQKANEFVPSESGSILLDDPFRKVAERKENALVFIATFGEGSESLVGQELSASEGIAGRVYQTGLPYLSENVDDDEFFFSKIDEQFGFQSRSIVCVPIYIGKTVCGVLELVNRIGGGAFTPRDMTLLEIFAGYTSFTLQNALDAKRAQELAKHDDLTGLYNDRWFHAYLTETLAEADRTGAGAVLMFMDLDNFKRINDEHGHLAGSQVLREVGFLLKRMVTRDRSLAARYGGDEFVMILPATGMAEGVRLAEAIGLAIASTTYLSTDYGFGMPAVHLRDALTASIGIAEYLPGRDLTPAGLEARKNSLLKRADAAMYEAKSRGKACIVTSTPAGGEVAQAQA